MFLRKQSWRNSFALKRGGNCIFLSQSSGDVVKWWRFWWLWGILENREVVSCEVVKSWSWNILLFEEFLHYAALRSEWQDYVFCSRLGIWIIFETQRFFIILVFLRKQSGNSLANCWSVCFKMFFPNGFICVVASTTLSHRGGKLFFLSSTKKTKRLTEIQQAFFGFIKKVMGFNCFFPLRY